VQPHDHGEEFWEHGGVEHGRTLYDEVLLGNLLFGEEWTGVRTAHLKYMRSEYGEERRFDLIADPGEQVNQVGSMHEALAAVRAQMRPMPAVRADLALAPPAAPGAKP
jgi:hypothetical protein